MAQEIGLDKPPTGTDIRENLNRTRTWINTFCVDGSHATQFGKMPMVQLNDYLVRKSVRTWYTSLDSAPYDIGLCAYAELLLHMIQYRRGMGPQDVLQQRLKEVRLAHRCLRNESLTLVPRDLMSSLTVYSSTKISQRWQSSGQNGLTQIRTSSYVSMRPRISHPLWLI